MVGDIGQAVAGAVGEAQTAGGAPPGPVAAGAPNTGGGPGGGVSVPVGTPYSGGVVVVYPPMLCCSCGCQAPAGLATPPAAGALPGGSGPVSSVPSSLGQAIGGMATPAGGGGSSSGGGGSSVGDVLATVAAFLGL